MNYPVWEVGIGLPMVIAIVAIVHVFVAHFAVGGGLFLVVFERQARKSNDTGLLAYTKLHSRFFMLLTLVFGALTGVGIWFTIGLIHPAATSSLIHAFVWFWATEWVMFFVEICASLVYYYGWEKMDAKTHLRVMWIYFIAAWGSLVVINGIITFMLTPNGWQDGASIWSAFFNPTYLPSLVIRTSLTILMAALFAFLTGSGLKDRELKSKVLKTASIWGLVAVPLILLSGLWYQNSLPQPVLDRMAGNWTALIHSTRTIIWSSALLFLGIIVSPLLRPKSMNRGEAIILLLLGLGIFGSFEWLREASRKPFVIAEYMYSDGTLVKDEAEIRQAGYTSLIKWKHDDPSLQGEDLFKAMCMRCHSLNGYNGLAAKTNERQWTEEDLTNLIPRLEHFRGAMPPFRGKDSEAGNIAGFISMEAKKLTSPESELTSEQVWQKNCGLCHTVNHFRSIGDTFDGMELEEATEVVMIAEELNDAMPPFMGDETDAEMVAKYILDKLKLIAEGGKE